MKKIICSLILLFSLTIQGQNEFVLAEKYYRDGEYKKATELYKNLYNKNPFNTTYLKRLISSYQEMADFSTAENLLKTKLNQHPNLVYLNVELGYNYQRQHKSEIAKTYYTKAINSIDKNIGMGGYIGRLFKENTLLDYAIIAYKKTMLLNPNANYQFNIAQI